MNRPFLGVRVKKIMSFFPHHFFSLRMSDCIKLHGRCLSICLNELSLCKPINVITFFLSTLLFAWYTVYTLDLIYEFMVYTLRKIGGPTNSYIINIASHAPIQGFWVKVGEGDNTHPAENYSCSLITNQSHFRRIRMCHGIIMSL